MNLNLGILNSIFIEFFLLLEVLKKYYIKINIVVILGETGIRWTFFAKYVYFFRQFFID